MKYALLVGINHFRGGDISGQDLMGCVNDIAGRGQTRDLIVQMLGVADANIHMYLDERARKKIIFDELSKFVLDILKPGDELLWWQSCHGTRYLHGGIVVDALCASDFTWDDPVLTGPDLAALLKQLKPGAKVTCCFDACHSGKEFRDLYPKPPTSGALVPYPKNRYFKPPPDILQLFRGVGQNPEPHQTPPGVILFSACDYDETASDAYLGSDYHGAFTICFWKAYTANLANQAALTATRAALTHLKFDQHPGLECDPALADAAFFGGTAPIVAPAFNPDVKPIGSFFGGYKVGELPPEAGFI